MNNNKTTKRALGSSIVALLICFTMLVGTTYAWFTDTVTSSGNIIKTGTLDAVVTWTDDLGSAEDTWNDVQAANADPIFDYELWEPGYVAARQLKVLNNGSLAFKYKVQIITKGEPAVDGDVNLADVIDVYYAPEKVDVPDRDLDNNANLTKIGTLSQFIAGEAAINDVLLAGEADYATLVLKMQESAGNEYQNLSVGTSFDIMLFATQYTEEVDSFDKNYDANAAFPKFGYGSAPYVEGEHTEITVKDGETKLGTVLIPAGAVADGTTKLDAKMEESAYVPNITIDTGLESFTMDIQVEGLKEDNQTPVKVQVYVGEGLQQSTMLVYHYDDPIQFIYDDNSGYIIFETTDFSPFTFVYDADSSEEYPEINYPHDLPYLSLTYAGSDVGSDIEWGKYGQWSPNPTIVEKYGNPSLEAAFTFKAIDTAETVATSHYKDWYCDFVVMLDKDLGENQIFLGGNYYPFGWVGFHNGDLELAANTEVPLLGSVTSNPWKYEAVVGMVETFRCGVADVDNQLEGATFTVMLRLTNPENTDEFYNVATVTYKFGGANSDGLYTIENINPVPEN